MDKKPNFYEGPWHIELFDRDGAEWGYIVSQRDTIVCEITGCLDSCGNLDNAYAISAVPLMFHAIQRQIENIEHWLSTGEAATPEQSKSIYEQLVAARDAALGMIND